MALESSSFRRLAAGPAAKRSARDAQPAKALTEGHDGVSLNRRSLLHVPDRH